MVLIRSNAVTVWGGFLCLTALLLFPSGCATLNPGAQKSTPVIHPDSSLDPVSSSYSPDFTTDDEEASETNTGENLENRSVDTLVGSLSTRMLVEEARELACTGALQYKEGNLEGAQSNLDAAVLNLQLADLPDYMQSIGFFQPYLPSECASVDLQKAYESILAMKPDDPVPSENIPDAGDAFKPADRAFIEMEIVRLMELLGENSSREDELDVFTSEVTDFINYFLTTKREWFERSYYRMMKYRDTVDTIMSEKRLPSELSYLAFIESGYMYQATSRSQARGIWQFIRSTGRNYGLKIGTGVDERLDPIKSTIAAREYLLDLISIFGSQSFLLAMASYNAGEGRVQRCLRDLDNPFEDRSFWQIRDCLRQETQEYIPRIIAAAIVCENPKRFGLNVMSRQEITSNYDIVVCPQRVRLSSVAQAAGIDLKILRELNPDLPSGGSWTPVYNTHLYIPHGSLDAVLNALEQMEKAPEPTFSGDYHVVRSGESLYSIGKRHRIPYKRLADWNNIPPPYKIKPGQRIYLQPHTTTASASAGPENSTICTDSLVYVVQKGNYLAGIGAMFGVTARDIMKINNLKRGIIYPGQRLVICPAHRVEIIKHRVTTGETAIAIAGFYGMQADDILFANGLTERDTLHVGQVLTIYRKK
ncbi:LysM peptidoglycan-binding domain-containing protein [bacterium]|nr:LysM peptidoglycan-binding domain-containing protein [candidate division CSSED10-310 bacterium]